MYGHVESGAMTPTQASVCLVSDIILASPAWGGGIFFSKGSSRKRSFLCCYHITYFAMPKRKAETLSQLPDGNGSKKAKHEETSKLNRPNLLDDSDSSSSDDESGGGASLEEAGFKINEEYAKRFEHNKKREELHRCKLVSQISNFPILNYPSGREVSKASKARERPIWRQI